MSPKSKASPRDRRLLLVVVTVVTVVVAGIFIVLNSQSSFSEGGTDYSGIVQARQADGGFVLGNPDAPITIVAFEDFLCGHCQRYKATVDQLIEAYVATGMARFEYRFMPVVHPGYSRLSAQLVECSETLRPNSFWDAHDVMYEVASARAYNDNSSRTFAEMMDIPYTDLLECTQGADQVTKDIRLADQSGVTGTPTVFVRYGDSPLQRSRFGQQPTFEQLGMLVTELG